MPYIYVVYVCAGFKPNSEVVTNSIDTLKKKNASGGENESASMSISKYGSVIVDNHLQVRGYANVFAVGDCIRLARNDRNSALGNHRTNVQTASTAQRCWYRHDSAQVSQHFVE